MSKIKFGTDGWRAIIAEDFTVENVARVAEATANWLKNRSKTPSAVIGHDCRFAGRLFADTVTKVLTSQGIKVLMSDGFVSTPMISLGAVKHGADLGIILTASHNPPSYNGFKLKGSFGGPLAPSDVQDIEDMIPDSSKTALSKVDLSEMEKSGMLVKVNLEDEYIAHVEKNFDLEAIRSSGMKLVYDAMYGAGQNVMKRLFPDFKLLHCDQNPGFNGQAPEPIHKNLKELHTLMSGGGYDCAVVTDGDADRIGMYDGQGNFVDSHHIILLLIHYLYKYKGMRGKVCTAFSTTPKVERLCKHYGLELQTVKIGFKYICEIMLKDDVLLGGEESGGIAIKGHIPERDGIWMGLVIWEFMAKSGKKLPDLIQEVYDIVGAFSYERIDLHLSETVKQRIVERTAKGFYTSFGSYDVKLVEDIDGYKYYFDDDKNQWLLIRASGTEPVLRTYAESTSRQGAFDILAAAEKTLLAD